MVNESGAPNTMGVKKKDYEVQKKDYEVPHFGLSSIFYHPQNYHGVGVPISLFTMYV